MKLEKFGYALVAILVIATILGVSSEKKKKQPSDAFAPVTPVIVPEEEEEEPEEPPKESEPVKSSRKPFPLPNSKSRVPLSVRMASADGAAKKTAFETDKLPALTTKLGL